MTHPLVFERRSHPVGSTWFLHTWHCDGATFIVGGLGSDGQVLRSDDDGQTWRATQWKNSIAAGPWKNKFGKDGAFQHGLRQIWGPSNKELYAVGEYGTILYSEDGAQSFTRLAHPVCDCIFGLVGYREKIFLSGDAGIRKKAGKRWTIVDDSASKLLARLYVSGDSLWCVGDEAVLLRSNDGKSFQRVPVKSKVNLYSFASLEGGQRIIAGGEQGGFLLSTDGGETFKETKRKENVRWSGLLVVGDSVLALGQKGILLASHDGGESWEALEVPATDELWSGTVTDQGTIIIVGRDGIVLRSVR